MSATHEESRLAVAIACYKKFSTVTEISKATGFTDNNVRYHLKKLGSLIVKDDSQMAHRFMCIGEYHHSPVKVPKLGSAPILPQGPLSFLADYERYSPQVGRLVEETHGGWIGRREGPHIGNGSYAHVDMFG